MFEMALWYDNTCHNTYTWIQFLRGKYVDDDD
jgi:hypothetical protein